jgi:hypothetical protein
MVSNGGGFLEMVGRSEYERQDNHFIDTCAATKLGDGQEHFGPDPPERIFDTEFDVGTVGPPNGETVEELELL